MSPHDKFNENRQEQEAKKLDSLVSRLSDDDKLTLHKQGQNIIIHTHLLGAANLNNPPPPPIPNLQLLNACIVSEKYNPKLVHIQKPANRWAVWRSYFHVTFSIHSLWYICCISQLLLFYVLSEETYFICVSIMTFRFGVSWSTEQDRGSLMPTYSKNLRHPASPCTNTHWYNLCR